MPLETFRRAFCQRSWLTIASAASLCINTAGTAKAPCLTPICPYIQLSTTIRRQILDTHHTAKKRWISTIYGLKCKSKIVVYQWYIADKIGCGVAELRHIKAAQLTSYYEFVSHRPKPKCSLMCLFFRNFSN